MAEAVPVRCPACLRENGYTAPVFPCACGSPVQPPLDLSAPPVPLTHRTWSDTWVAVRCGACGRESEWPQPELGCGSCGTVVRLPVHPLEREEPVTPGGGAADARGEAAREVRTDAGAGPAAGAGPDPGAASGAGSPAATPGAAGGAATAGGTASAVGSAGSAGPAPADPADPAQAPATPVPRPAFRPVTIRTARDAVATAALYLRWLGFQDVRQPDGRPIPSAAVDLRAPGLVAQVDPTTAPAGLRAVECVWLNGLTASATSVYFALAGYTKEARTRADDLGIPLFVMDLTGMPQPVNDPADELIGMGA
uniref:Restriction endonuclease type IV Mrr domain-containing protein n=1 Tax=Streptomyces sp. NBC_00049 TaxID=2903617 RepID=A0AAU2JXU1_9ACTN